MRAFKSWLAFWEEGGREGDVYDRWRVDPFT